MLRIAALALVLCFGTAAFGQVQYTVTDLGAGTAFGINNAGQVVGQFGIGHACIWSNGTLTDCTLNSGSLTAAYGSTAYGINASGQVALTAVTEDAYASPIVHAFLYSNGVLQDLGTLPGGTNSYGSAINASGQVVGFADMSADCNHAFLYSNGTMQDLVGGEPDSYALARGINDSGQVVGKARMNTGIHAFLYTNGTIQDLGTLGGDTSYAYGINSGGQVVGWASTNSLSQHAFLYNNGIMHDLGTLGGTNSSAFGINSSGQVVGDADISGNYSHAFLYGNGTMTDLNSLIDPASGWTLFEAKAINDNGQIVGIGNFNGSGQEVFLLTPIPEPATMALVGLGLAGLVLRRKGSEAGKRRQQDSNLR